MVRKFSSTLAGYCAAFVASVCLWSSQAPADDIRVQFGFSITDAIFRTRPREFLEDSPLIARLDRLSGGDGPGLSLAVWYDRPRSRGSLSYGVEVFSSRSDPSAIFTLIQGSDRLTFNLNADAEFTTAFFNVARRYDFGKYHPYFGAGLGVGFAELTPRTSLIQGKLDSPHAGAQALIGVDVDLSDRSYFGISARLYYVDGRPFDVDLQYADRALTMYVGYRF